MSHSSIYMDNQATTRVDPRVVAAMLPWFSEDYGNAGSATHAFGWTAKDAVERARETICAAVGARAREIVFTSGATESNNLALRGAAESAAAGGSPGHKPRHIISVATEHPSVLDPLAKLASDGFEITLLPVRESPAADAGRIDLDQLADAIRPETVLVSVMLANNEIGTIQPLAEIGKICKTRGVLLHSDATQAVGKMPVDIEDLQVDLMSFSAHKIYGPKGIGGLYVRGRNPRVRLEPQIAGGGQERGLRSGTLNVPGIVGFAKALELCQEEMPSEPQRLAALRDRLFAGLCQAIPGVSLNGPALNQVGWRLPGNLNVSFENVEGETLLLGLDSIALSTGSACSSATPEPSHVLTALGLPETATRGSIRFSLGRFNTSEEVEIVIATLAQTIAKLRDMSSIPHFASGGNTVS